MLPLITKLTDWLWTRIYGVRPCTVDRRYCWTCGQERTR